MKFVSSSLFGFHSLTNKISLRKLRVEMIQTDNSDFIDTLDAFTNLVNFEK